MERQQTTPQLQKNMPILTTQTQDFAIFDVFCDCHTQPSLADRSTIKVDDERSDFDYRMFTPLSHICCRSSSHALR